MRLAPLALLLPLVLVALAPAARAAPQRGASPRSSLDARRARTAAAAAAVRSYIGETELGEVTAFTHLRAASKSSGGLVGWVDVRVMAWYPALDGHISDGNDRLDVDELGLDDQELSVMPQLHLSAGGLGVRADAFFFETEGQERVSREFTFGGFTFPFDDDVRSELRLDNIRLIGILPIVKTEMFTLWLQGGVSYYRFDGEVESDSGSGEDDGDLPVPVAGVLVQAKVWKLIVELDVSGLAIKYGSDLEGTALDVQVSAGYVFAKIVSVRVGYRFVTLDGRADDFDIDVTLDGFFLGGSINF